jgi:hypothetical protein
MEGAVYLMVRSHETASVKEQLICDLLLERNVRHVVACDNPVFMSCNLDFGSRDGMRLTRHVTYAYKS